jgi:hypothetical protein
MTVQHTQSVIITVVDDEHNARFERTIESHWPGHTMPAICDLIEQTARELIEQIQEAEASL